jgi:hypothetical protein
MRGLESWSGEMSKWARSGIVGIARRRVPDGPAADGPIITQPRAVGSGYVLLDAHAFRNAMNVLIARARAPFTVLILRTHLRESTLALGEMIIRQLRGASGDLVGYLEGAIAVALHDTDHVGAVSFADRARDEWRRLGRGELEIEIAEHPLAESLVIELLTTDWSLPLWNTAVIDDRVREADQPRRAPDERRTGWADRQ